MKLEFYLDFDKWTVNDLNDFNKGYDDIAIMYTVASFELYRKMVKKYPYIEITPINTREINTNCCCPAYGIATHVIKNPESKKFMVISWCDKAYYIGKGDLEKSHPLYERYKDSWGWDLDNCVNIDLLLQHSLMNNTRPYDALRVAGLFFAQKVAMFLLFGRLFLL